MWLHLGEKAILGNVVSVGQPLLSENQQPGRHLWVEASLPHLQPLELHPNSWLSPMVHLFVQTCAVGSYLPTGTFYSPSHQILLSSSMRACVHSMGHILFIHLDIVGFFKYKSCLLPEDGLVSIADTEFRGHAV